MVKLTTLSNSNQAYLNKCFFIDGPAEVEKVSSSADRPDAVKDSALVKENCM